MLSWSRPQRILNTGLVIFRSLLAIDEGSVSAVCSYRRLQVSLIFGVAFCSCCDAPGMITMPMVCKMCSLNIGHGFQTVVLSFLEHGYLCLFMYDCHLPTSCAALVSSYVSCCVVPCLLCCFVLDVGCCLLLLCSVCCHGWSFVWEGSTLSRKMPEKTCHYDTRSVLFLHVTLLACSSCYTLGVG